MGSFPNLAKGEGFVRTYELIESLQSDVYKAFELLDPSKESQFFRRIVIRNIFGYIEAIIEVVKFEVKKAISFNEFTTTLSNGQKKILYEQRIKEDGTVESITIPVEENLRETFKIAKKVWNIEGIVLDCSSKNYQYFLKTKRVRNKLTHPKIFYDIEITDDDVIIAAKTFEWVRAGTETLFKEHVANLMKDMPDSLKKEFEQGKPNLYLS